MRAAAPRIDADDVIALAEQLIRIPSFTEYEKDAAQFLAARLERAGFDEVIVQEISPGRLQTIARIAGRDPEAPSLMLNGHLDIDCVTESWRWDPFTPRREGNRLWGAGIHNMKSGVAALVGAAEAIRRAGVALQGDLVVACVAGELQGGLGTKHMLEQGIVTTHAIVPEPYSIDHILTRAAGVHKCAISTVGRSEHTSRSDEGVDAIRMMSRVVEALERLDLGPRDAFIQGVPRQHVGSIIGGRSRDYDLSGISNLADYCTILVDTRYPAALSAAEIDRRIVALLDELARQDPRFRYEYNQPPPPRFRVGGIEMPPTDVASDSRVVECLEQAHERVTGRPIRAIGAVHPYSICGNDTAHLQRAGIECCLYGPRGYPLEVEKHVRIDEMLTCSEVLLETALELCGARRDSPGPPPASGQR